LEEPLWLSGKVMERENKWNKKIPGSLPSPGTFLKKCLKAEFFFSQVSGKFFPNWNYAESGHTDSHGNGQLIKMK
jgi:hypothetical protein